MKILKSTRILIFSGLLFLASVALVAFDDDDFELSKNLDIYHSLFRELNLYYVDKTNSGELVKQSIDAMLKNLDPYTVFIPENRIEDYRVVATGEYGGIGVVTAKVKDYIKVLEVYQGMPADQAGMRPGDWITAIAGESTKGKELSDLSVFLKGAPGSSVDITIKREVENNREFTLAVKRANIELAEVYSTMLNKEVGYVKLNSFSQEVSVEVRDAMQKLIDEHQAKYMVFDLRGNPGGLLIEAVRIVNLFVNKGQEIVSMRGKATQWNNIYSATQNPEFPDLPLVVLINNNSASASEIVSGALQDLDRAVIVGQRSFGKGLVQTTRKLNYNTQLKLTTAKYYIPSGRCIQALDYSHRRTDGSVDKVADSLMTAFTTAHGRTVFDGGGIAPDINVPIADTIAVINSLLSEYMVFDYASQWAHSHDSIAAADKFTLTDSDFDKFATFVKNSSFSYYSATEKQLKQLEDLAKRENYFEGAKTEFDQLRKKLKHQIDSDMNTYRKDLLRLLRIEIASRYYYSNGKTVNALTDDREILQAIDILTEAELKQYNEILKVNKD